MPKSASQYLNEADSQSRRAMNADSGADAEWAFHTALAQVAAIQAVAAAIDRLAAAVEAKR